jgi:prepilin-type N-terminal cleavage/methylation domain-containing protein
MPPLCDALPRALATVSLPTLKRRMRLSHAKSRHGFTLIELLVVMGIMSIMVAILVLAVPAIKGSQDITKSSDDIQGVLEQARTLAMADNTYVWVGFFEENPNSIGTAGVGQAVISVVSSSDGTQLFTNSNPPTVLPSASLTQVNKLMKLPSLHLDILSAAAVTRPSVPANTYQIGSSSFSNNIYFTYPLSGSQYKFYNIIQFNPQGDATRIADTPTQVIEVGLRPAHGNVATASSKNVVAIQVAGIGGHVTVYRP